MSETDRHLVVGIDPGRRGAIAWLWGTRDHPFERCDLVEMRQPDLVWQYSSSGSEFHEIGKRLSTVTGTQQSGHVFIEAPLAPPFDSHKSLVTIGANFGFLIGHLRWEVFWLDVVNPQTWKRAIGIWGPGGKDRAEVVFRALFDFEETDFNPSSIDAALIAVYGMSQFFPKEHWPIPIRKGSCRFVPWPQRRRSNSNGNGRRNQNQEGTSLEDAARKPRRSAPRSKGPRRQRTPRTAEGKPGQVEAPNPAQT